MVPERAEAMATDTAPVSAPDGGTRTLSTATARPRPSPRHLRKVIAAILIPFAAAVLVGLVVLWPGGAPPHERTGVGFDRQTSRPRSPRSSR